MRATDATDLGIDVELSKGLAEHGLRSALDLTLNDDRVVGVEEFGAEPGDFPCLESSPAWSRRE